MQLYDADYEKEKVGIRVNSFYDVNQVKYTEEELKLYHDLTGMPLAKTYDELMSELTE